MNQLRLDLRRRIHAKHHQWINDALDLYEMAELSDKEAFEDAYTVLMSAMLSMSIAMNIDCDKLVFLVRKAFEMQRNLP